MENKSINWNYLDVGLAYATSPSLERRWLKLWHLVFAHIKVVKESEPIIANCSSSRTTQTNYCEHISELFKKF